MTKSTIAWVVLIAAASIGLSAAYMLQARRIDRLERFLSVAPGGDVFTESMVAELPDVARRYFLHAIRPGTPLARSVRLTQSAVMKPRPDADFVELAADQLLTPHTGFLWNAGFRMGPLSVHVVDHYAQNEGAVRVALGLIPIKAATGPDVTRSSRHRLAIESVWVPSALLPQAGVDWEAVDDEHARAVVTIDGDCVALTLTVSSEGKLTEITMERHGDVGVEWWGPIPYGFAVEEERTFEGYTIPTRVRGGWWYGTERYDVADASLFRVVDARFR